MGSSELTVIASPVLIQLGTEEPPPLWPLRSPGEFDWWRLGNRVYRLLSWMDGAGLAGTGSVANRSALHPTRLETRTKESNMRASRWVVRNPKAK